jgi:hypothetical protein
MIEDSMGKRSLEDMMTKQDETKSAAEEPMVSKIVCTLRHVWMDASHNIILSQTVSHIIRVIFNE